MAVSLLVAVFPALVLGLVLGLALGVAGGSSQLRARTAERDQARAAADDAKRLVTDAGDHFKALSADALRESQQSFLTLAQEHLGRVRSEAAGDLDLRRQAIEQLVAPLGASMHGMEEYLRRLEVSREHAYRALTEQVRTLREGHDLLRTETANLVTALRSPSARGRWGELQLRRVVELAGMLQHCDFVEQRTVEGDSGRLRPDLVVRLPGAKQIVVDAKVPLAAFLEASGATDEQSSRAHLLVHARHVRTHVDQLAAKAYWEQLDHTPDFVVMFVPGDPLLAAALEHDPGLLEYSVANRVLLATPVTLIALLRSVAYGWQQEALADNAKAIAELGAQLQQRLAKYVSHFQKVGRGLDGAVRAYNDAAGSLESRVLVAARRLGDLEVGGHDLPEPAQVETRARSLAVVEEEAQEPLALEA